MFQKLEDVEKKYVELTEKISNPEIINQQNEWRTYMKEHAEIEPIVIKYREYKKVKQQYEDAKEMLNDPDLKDLAEIEMLENKEKLPQIEEELNLHPKVQDCIVTSVLDKIRGQAIVAYVVPEDDSLTIAELKDFCAKSKNLSQYKKPRFFCIVESLPFTATGKKKHYMLRQQAEEDLRNGILKKD